MAKDTYGTIYIIVDYRVGIFPFNVNKFDVTDTLLSNGASDISFQPAQLTKIIVLQSMIWFWKVMLKLWWLWLIQDWKYPTQTT